MISTRALGGLPGIDELRRVTKGLAALDALLCPDWESRYYSFNSRWDAATGAEMASMRDGSGDEWFLWFSAAGAALKGFAHEAFMSPFGGRFTPAEQRGRALYPGLLAGFPEALAPFLDEPAFDLDQATFVLWRLREDTAWRHGDLVWPALEDGDDPDGSEALLSPLAGRPEDYVAWAAEYFELEIAPEDAAHVLALRPLDGAIVARLGGERTLEELREDLEEIGYPLGAAT
ncbi:MAG TPA: hypothetical protein PLR99_13155 [Polyangiaceae bacterium]|nr:hypothetical protein [Polyangiaceae bacterium]